MGSGPALVDAVLARLHDLPPEAAAAVLVGTLMVGKVGVPLPEDVLLLSTGYLASTGAFDLPAAIALGFFGALAGDALVFAVGRRFGEAVFELAPVRRLLPRSTVAAAQRRVRAHGGLACFGARFVPGMRGALFLSAGAMGIPPRTWITWDLLGACLTVPLTVGVGWALGDRIDQVLGAARHVQGGVVVGVLVLVVGYVAWKRGRGGRQEAGS
ncbi:MAG: DedA family protein [Alphaproteobacteria bacterium]|nr:DedA family protein [Alphaproteobacteria bacterium]